MSSCDFFWQEDDFVKIENALHNRLTLITANDFGSQYNSVYKYCASLDRDKFVVYKIIGSAKKHTRPLYPFLECISERLEYESDLNIQQLKKHIIKDITRSDAVASLISGLKLGQEHEASKLLTKQENDILTTMHKLSCKKDTIFIFRYAHYYDEISKSFINLMLSETLFHYYPFLKKSRFIFLDNDFAEPYYRDIQSFEHNRIFMYEPQDRDSADIVNFFMGGNTEKTFAQELFTLCAGKLSELELLCNYIKKSTEIFDPDNLSFKKMLYGILEKRLYELSARRPLVHEVLRIASEIEDVEGHFTSEELDFIYNQQQDKIREIIEYSNKEHLIAPQQNYHRFAHKIIMEFFLQSQINVKKEANRRIAQAIERYNPEDYYSLYHYYKKAGMDEKACVKYIVSYIQKKIRVHNEHWKNDNDAAELIKTCNLYEYCDLIDKFYEFYYRFEYEKALEILDDALFIKNNELYLETLYLRSLTLKKSGNNKELLTEALDDMRLIREKTENDNPGLWSRASSTLISYYVNFGEEKSNAKTLFKELEWYYRQNFRSAYFQKGLYTLYRKSGAILSPELILGKLKESVAFFESTYFSAEFIMALNNYGASLMVLGEFEEAYTVMCGAIKKVNESPNVYVNKYYLLNNYLVSGVLSGQLRTDNILDIFDREITRLENSEVKIIPLISLGIFHALNLNLNKARELFMLAGSICREMEDDYFNYYIYANLASVEYLLGNEEQALGLLQKYCAAAPALTPPTLRHHYDNRFQKFMHLFQNPRPMMVPEFDSQFIDKEPVGSWSLIGRGFLFSDIQFWSES